MGTEIKIKDVGPVVEFQYELEKYGLHVLEGPNGGGKSTIQRVVELATNGRSDTRLTKRDGAPRGESTVAGKTIRVTKQIRTEGELDVSGIGDVSIMGLHSPKFDKPETRDRHRIPILLRLAKVEIKASDFYPLLGGEEPFSAIVPGDALKTDDPVELAARIKRTIEKHAVLIEEHEHTALADARAHRALYEAEDVNVPMDESKLQAELENAIKIQQDIQTRRATAARAKAAAAAARETLAGLGEGLTVEEAEEHAEATSRNLDGCAFVVRELRAKIADLEASLNVAAADQRAASAAHTAANNAVSQAKREGSLRSELQVAIEAGSAEGPSTEDLQVAEAVVADARGAITRGARARDALAAKAKAERHQEAAKAHHEEARRLRDAAADTATVLTDAIGKIEGCPLRVRLNDDGEPVLVMNDEKAEPFDRRSVGQRWTTVMQIAAGENRLLVLPEEGYSSLTPSARAQVHQLAQEHHCFVLGAKAADCELCAHLYDPETDKD